MGRRVVGPRMVDLCHILQRMGGTAPSGRDLYMRLSYGGGGSSNRYGSAVLYRCIAAGLMRAERVHASRYRIHLTEKGGQV